MNIRKILKIFHLVSISKYLYIKILYKIFNYRRTVIKSDCHKKKIFIDLSNIINTDYKTGVQRVTRNLFSEIKKISSYEVIPVYSSLLKNGYMELSCCGSDFGINKLKKTNKIISVQTGDIFFGLDIAYTITLSQIHNIKYMADNGVKIFFIVHDILPLEYPDYFSRHTDLLQKKWLSEFSNYSTLLCVSKTVAEKLECWLYYKNIEIKDIKWFYNGYALDNALDNINIHYKNKNIIFTVVGTIEPRKCHLQILYAFKILWDKGINIKLIFVGKNGWNNSKIISEINKYKKNNNFVWYDNASDSLLEEIYKLSDCIIMASVDEGFGLPIIEAVHFNKYLILRDIKVFREITDGNAYFFSGYKAITLANAIQQWISLYNKGQAPSSQDIKIYSWHETAEYVMKHLILKSGVV